MVRWEGGALSEGAGVDCVHVVGVTSGDDGLCSLQKDPDSRPKYADLLVSSLNCTCVVGSVPSPSLPSPPLPVLQETRFLKEYEKKEVDVAGWLKRVMP